MNYEIVNLDEKTVAGYCARTNNASPDMGQIIGGLWKKFYSDKGYPMIPNKTNSKALEIYTDYEDDEKSDYTVMVSCEVNDILNLSEDFNVIKNPCGQICKIYH